MTKRKYFTYILVLGSLTALGPFSIDMYLPGFEDIARSLGTSVANVGLSLASYFVGISLGQLLYGPLLDRYGRKKPLYAGLSLYIVATMFCMQARDINVLIALRFIQAVGSCAAQVAAMAMVRDLFGPKESAKVLSLLLLVLGASPMIAPTAGGYIVVTWGWRAIFLVLLILGAVILLLSIFFLPDSYPADVHFSLKPGPIIRNFISVFLIPQFLIYVFVQSLAFAGLFAYVSGSPVVFMSVFHVDKKVYGWIFAFLSVAFIGLSQFNSLLLRRYTSQQIIRVALIGQVVVGLVFWGFAQAGWLSLTSTMGFLFLFLGCLGYTNPNAAALAMAPFAKNAGTASSLLGALQLGVGALAATGVSAFADGTARPMAAIIAVTSVLALGISFFHHRRYVPRTLNE
ncbi:multidrug effflux MFS transporter [Puia dinghuensis]|uniref:Bcr/CflA family drug resistance efflux transporter n=1 Tax=Puia dinghuensis TaxID=1792502 RepID=A0A8J2UCZ3_9BACT|nr:multidrug effflux MFS transporter [Puia dinghuensis]GGB00185.1 Bcr/CflA family drug resistance efflux transporter [Puia dinghuensis]